jgi:hypothetical protein
MGETSMMVGNATVNANAQAFSHKLRILLTRPTLKILITKDITQDISNDMKNENTIL